MSKRVDAVLVPRAYTPEDGDWNKLSALAHEFGPVLGVEPSQVKIRPGDPYFLSADPHDLLCFPKTHRLAGFPRYDWAERPEGEGVLYGTLRMEALAPEPSFGLKGAKRPDPTLLAPGVAEERAAFAAMSPEQRKAEEGARREARKEGRAEAKAAESDG